MADVENTLKQADEALNGARELLNASREEYAKRVSPLYEQLRGLGEYEHEREYARSIRRQIAQLEQSQREAERPIVAEMVKIESMRIRPLIISRDDLPKGFPLPQPPEAEK